MCVVIDSPCVGAEAVKGQTGSKEQGAAAGGGVQMGSGAIQNARWRSAVGRLDKTQECAAWCMPV